ncbi:conjugal transfer protein TraF [Rhizobacter sp. Root1221]|uniref:conjugal transfer protein TraF n=1 Tax=Rhizobacter sp. Root1221 TaxID=1736433 RepID=UPI0006FCF850|nr:conjugal transfer protein TraF [Rhizobacter sp. Root1221]KQW02848.1 conjugal transfer protein TraF [Rhizobacter sp. Root1221]
MPTATTRTAARLTALLSNAFALAMSAGGAAAQIQAGEQVAAAAPTSAQSLFWLDHRRGWHFYDDPELEVEPKPLRPAKPVTKQKPPDPRAPELVEFEALQKRLEEYRNIAIIRPTEANVRRYMELEARVVRQASYFADVAQRVAWTTPNVDMTLEGRPVNAQAIQVYDREQSADRQKSVAALGRTHVVFFFFRSDCPYCHAFAPTLEAFQARHGIQVVPISVDGGGLPNFQSFRRDNGIAKTLQVTQVPAVLLAEPFTGKISPLGYGVLSESQLLERIATVAAPGADEMVPSATRHISLR